MKVVTPNRVLIGILCANCSSRVTVEHVVGCTDSTVALTWVKNSPHRWETFVANRVAIIQSATPVKLLENKTWVKGPIWLEVPFEEWPIGNTVEQISAIPEETLVAVPTTVADLILKEDNTMRELTERMSSWSKLIRVTVYILRYLKILPRHKFILAADLETAERFLIKSVKTTHFTSEIEILKAEKACSCNLRQLSPFLDKDGLLTVGGPLSKATIDYDHQHPYLLANKDHLVDILIDHFHIKTMHTRPHLLLSLLQQKYWILSARNLVRKRIKLCNFCFKFRPKIINPVMADLPKARVTEAKAFLESGVDFAGPLYITLGRRRGIRSQKAYICLFRCLATKAIHIELAFDLTTATFINCFKRFLARRGPCSVVYSDCGTNFIGARTELKDIYKFVTAAKNPNGSQIRAIVDKILRFVPVCTGIFMLKENVSQMWFHFKPKTLDKA
ncbi:hypothetical protein NQ315_008909 [Exocentrus adspersus]|uniref:Integrase zinc-binding domain-containing protein n=1 Tax=Exocentrus adspersus TaxID=1586481 RepID=A0AAV8V6W8_9CUCU|nr:hypothetical protein NQ315_008909 [Exocentrus adspersus]